VQRVVGGLGVGGGGEEWGGICGPGLFSAAGLVSPWLVYLLFHEIAINADSFVRSCDSFPLAHGGKG
jgi:hypothetical protein